MNDSPETTPVPVSDPYDGGRTPASAAPGNSAGTERPLSEVERIVDTYVAPSKTFTDIRRSARWWGPYILSILVSVLFTFAMAQRIGWDRVAQNTLAQSPSQQQRMENMTPEQRATMVGQVAAAIKYTAYATPVIALLVLLIVSAVLLGTINFIFGGQARFGQMFAVVNYAYLPNVLKYLFAAVMLYVAPDPDRFNIQNPVGTNPGFFLEPDTSKWISSLLSSIDLFSIWIVVLLVIGCAIVGRVRRGQAATAVVGWYVLATLIGAAWAGIRG